MAGVNRANGYRLYDVAGNVFEWSWDWYDDSWYDNAGATTQDTRGPNTASGGRVLRGGSWFNFLDRPTLRQSPQQHSSVRWTSSSTFGFRSARGL
ncbi:formylglycine-generating enzyme family protein [bacterium]|nr:formylglycine-generating enzyme family protein [bacterium]